MKLPGEMNIQGLALFGRPQATGVEAIALTARMFDTDGDGRNDLFLVDFDGDGAFDSAVCALDADGDGVSDTFVEYNEAGEIQAVGRLDPDSREFEVLSEDSAGFEDLLSSLDLVEAPAPDEALFTAFDDPYLVDSLGTAGDEVPENLAEPGDFVPASVTEIDEQDLGTLETGASLEDGGGPSGQPEGTSEDEESESPPLEVTPRVVEIEDYSGAGDGSDLHANIDQDGDGLADDDQRLSQTSDGTWHGDVNRDGYSDEVAFDRDHDGRIESVDTTGRGSSTDRVGAEQVVAPQSVEIVDRLPGEDAAPAAETAAAVVTEAEDDSSASDVGSGSTIDSGTTADEESSCESDVDESGNSSDDDAGSTTLDTDSSDSGGTDTEST
jgi:hypothetical protein